MRKLFFLLMAICGVMLTGCAQLVQLNDQESDVLAEYMAGTMLRHDGNYKEALIYPETTETEETDTAEAALTENTIETTETTDNTATADASARMPGAVTPPAGTQNGTITSLANIFKSPFKGNFNITCSNYKFYDSYPDENNLFTLEAAKDKKLLAIAFNVKNITKKAKTLDLKYDNLTYQLTNNEDIVYYPMMTLLDNDIQYINLDIAAGKTQKAVVLFDVPKNIDMSDMMLTISYEDKTTVLDLNQ